VKGTTDLLLTVLLTVCGFQTSLLLHCIHLMAFFLVQRG